ncbi:hypothetical protein BDY24DRAFT_401860 [Mrakia frigida]|uniref:uncharacterized protein n=1 Tax=Mrakia frigida TaxID=29902 RepID=UPI003FCC0E6D
MRPSLLRFASSTATSRPRSFGKYFREHCFAIEAVPLWIIATGSLTGGIWCLTRAALGPDVHIIRDDTKPHHEHSVLDYEQVGQE